MEFQGSRGLHSKPLSQNMKSKQTKTKTRTKKISASKMQLLSHSRLAALANPVRQGTSSGPGKSNLALPMHCKSLCFGTAAPSLHRALTSGSVGDAVPRTGLWPPRRMRPGPLGCTSSGQTSSPKSHGELISDWAEITMGRRHDEAIQTFRGGGSVP